MWTATGKEVTRVSSAAEDKFITVTSLRKCSPNKCFREFIMDPH
jgi:hypothetical protein